MFLAASSFLCFCFQKKIKLVVLSTCIFIPSLPLSLPSSAYNVVDVNNSALLPFLRHLFLNFPFFHTPVIFLLTACIFVLENPGVAQPTQASAQQMAFYYPGLGYGYTLVCVLFILVPSSTQARFSIQRGLPLFLFLLLPPLLPLHGCCCFMS